MHPATAVPTISVSLDDLPRYYANLGRHVPIAAAAALNSTAWQVKRNIETQAKGDLKFKRPAPVAMGIKPPMKGTGTFATPTNLSSEIFTERRWMEHQVQGGTAEPLTGYKHNGRQYLLIPSPALKRMSATTRSKAFKGKTPFVIQSARGLVLAVRMGDDGKKSKKNRTAGTTIRKSNIRILGILVPKAAYADDIKWVEVSTTTAKEFTPRFFKAMDRAAATSVGKSQWRYYK